MSPSTSISMSVPEGTDCESHAVPEGADCESHAVPEGMDYESEIHFRRSFAPDPRNRDMQDSCMMALRELISKVDPKYPTSLVQFTSIANTNLDLLVQLGVDGTKVRYWESRCREVESIIRQMRSLTVVRTRASLSDLEETVRRRQASKDAADDALNQSTKALEKHHHSLSEIEGLTSQMKDIWKEINGLMSRKATLQEEIYRQDKVIRREEQKFQIHHQTMLTADAALKQAVEELRVAEAESQTLSMIMKEIHDLQTRFL